MEIVMGKGFWAWNSSSRVKVLSLKFFKGKCFEIEIFQGLEFFNTKELI
jgi:hypothetical protein